MEPRASMADYTILIVDYEPRSVEGMRRSLEAAGFRVEVARDGAAGIEAFERLRPQVTVIEAMIPKVHGFEVCQRLKETEHGQGSGIVMVTSAYRGRKYRHQAVHQCGADDFLEKPVAEDRLLSTVQALLPATCTPASAAPVTSRTLESEITSILDDILPG